MLLSPLAACGKPPAKAAAPDIQAVLTAIQSGDAKAFEAHLDRPAVRADLRQQLMSISRADALVVDGGPSDFALDRRIGPDAVKLVRQGSAEPLAAAPSPAQTAALIKPVDKSRVCVHDLTPAQACVLTFAKEPAGWRLVAMPAQPGSLIEIGPEPAKK